MLIDPLDREHTKAFKSFKRRKIMARLVLLLERVVSGLWRIMCWTLLFCALWLFQIPAFFGVIIATLVTLLFFAGLVYFALKDFHHLRWPSLHDALRRLERDSGFEHRPLASIEDVLANPEKPDTRNLWQSNIRGLRRFLSGIRLNMPNISLARRDPYSLRYGALFLFVIGMITAGSLSGERIWDGLTPISIDYKARAKNGITLWITPPEYTKASQIILDGKQDGAIAIPQGSTLKASISGGIGAPKIIIAAQEFDLEKTEDKNYTAEIAIPQGERISVRQMMITRAAWDYTLTPDLKPVIITKSAPEALPDGPLRFSFMVYDDYGVQNLNMRMTLAEKMGVSPMGQPIEEMRAIFSPAATEFDIAPLYDLTAHPWAGLSVQFEFEAIDHIGQSASVPPISITLPERKFSHPVASKIIELRKQLIATPEAPYRDIAKKLEKIRLVPGAYQHDKIAFLNLTSASARLFYNKPSLETSRAVVAQLWDIALRIEDGNLTFAARDLRDAQRALQDVMSDPDASEAEIATAMNELRQAMMEYFLELQKEMQKRMADGQAMPMMPPDMLQQMITPDGLNDFLNKLESQMMSGDRQSAQEMLSQLQKMMDALDPSIAGPMPPDMQMMSDGVNELQELIERQEELLDQTQKQSKLQADLDALRASSENSAAIPQVNSAPNKAEQEALRFVLGQLMLDAAEVLDNIPEEMGLAEQEMRQSSEALGENNPAGSVPHQEQALEYLKQSQQSLSDQFMARMQQMTGMMFGGNSRLDPLGRPMGPDGDGKAGVGSDVEVPSDAEQKRAREILDLLRRRSGEHDRPKIERDYYRRLLKQF